jgi:hypothetical protein
MGAARVGSTTHPTIAKLWSERNWYSQIGAAIDPRPVRDRPWREVREYEVYMQAEAHVHKEQELRSRGR